MKVESVLQAVSSTYQHIIEIAAQDRADELLPFDEKRVLAAAIQAESFEFMGGQEFLYDQARTWHKHPNIVRRLQKLDLQLRMVNEVVGNEAQLFSSLDFDGPLVRAVEIGEYRISGFFDLFLETENRERFLLLDLSQYDNLRFEASLALAYELAWLNNIAPRDCIVLNCTTGAYSSPVRGDQHSFLQVQHAASQLAMARLHVDQSEISQIIANKLLA